MTDAPGGCTCWGGKYGQMEDGEWGCLACRKPIYYRSTYSRPMINCVFDSWDCSTRIGVIQFVGEEAKVDETQRFDAWRIFLKMGQ